VFGLAPLVRYIISAYVNGPFRSSAGLGFLAGMKSLISVSSSLSTFYSSSFANFSQAL
jgi:hypothetical protein